MNERYMEALEQYEIGLISVRKGRESWICETKDGCRLLKEYRGTLKRLEFEEEGLGRLDISTSLRADRYIRNKEGNLLTTSGDGGGYILKEWFNDRECSLRDSYEIRQAVSRLALLHRQLRFIPFKEEWAMGSTCEQPLEQELLRHNKELLRVRNYIRSKRRKSEFELSVIESYHMFWEQAVEAADGMAGLWNSGEGDSLQAAQLGLSEKPLYLCHGDLDHHHLFMGNGYTAIIEYNRMHLGIQAWDLYRFMRKVLEKQGWNMELGFSMLEAYERVLPMERKELACLYYLFLYPEKYWKQLNFYYNANKAWIPARNADKLKNLKLQQQPRNNFLKRLGMEIGV